PADRGKERLRVSRIVSSGRKAARIAHVQIGHSRFAKDAVVDMEVASTPSIADADAAMVEGRIPHPDVERVEIPQGHARFRVPHEMRSPDARFGEAVTLEAPVNAVRHVHKVSV